MRIITLTPYQYKIQRNYLSDGEALFLGDTSIASFEAYLPDAQSIKDTKLFFQNDDENYFYIKAQFGQSINGVERVTLHYQYQAVLLVSDGNNYRLVQGIVQELPPIIPVGRYWRLRPVAYDMNIEKDLSLGSGTNWTPYDQLYMI